MILSLGQVEVTDNNASRSLPSYRVLNIVRISDADDDQAELALLCAITLPTRLHYVLPPRLNSTAV